MQFIKNWWYTDQYYKITDDGTQKSMYDSSDYKCILRIHKSPTGIQYRFIQLGQPYQTKSLPYTIFGLSVTIQQRSFVLPVKSFLLHENTLNETVALWLCKNYLYVSPGEITWSLIDNVVQIHTCKTIHFGDTITYN